MSRALPPGFVEYTITQADVDQATQIAHAALRAASGLRPITLAIAAVVVAELARSVAGSSREDGDALSRNLMTRWRALYTDQDVAAILRGLANDTERGVS